tara:strand:+ start:843 stop:1556 length:714 start_codon:yes stop_codon:yes gene_type:complete
MIKIVFTGGSGRFGNELKKIKSKFKILYPNKKDLNIKNQISIEKYLKKNKPKYFIHAAGLSRPMELHNKDISKSIDLNILGTCNVVKACKKFSVKLIYFSTNYVYPGVKGNYSEESPVKPINNYALSKLGGECAVSMYNNSLILRICMTQEPFVHKKAFSDVYLNFMFHKDLAKNLLKLLNYKGILNIGGKSQTVYDFARIYNKKIKKISARKIFGKKFPLRQSMNIKKFDKIRSKN